MAGWGFKKADDIGSGRMGVVDRETFGANLPYRGGTQMYPLVKSGGGGSGSDIVSSSGGGGGEPLGCPRCVGWYWIPLGCAGLMQFAAWILARK